MAEAPHRTGYLPLDPAFIAHFRTALVSLASGRSFFFCENTTNASLRMTRCERASNERGTLSASRSLSAAFLTGRWWHRSVVYVLLQQCASSEDKVPAVMAGSGQLRLT